MLRAKRGRQYTQYLKLTRNMLERSLIQIAGVIDQDPTDDENERAEDPRDFQRPVCLARASEQDADQYDCKETEQDK